MTNSQPPLLRRAIALVLIFLTIGLAAFASEATKSFNLPAGDAAQTLKQFSTQSGREIVFAPAAVSAVKTNEVKGDLEPKAALDALLADTGLVATQDAKTGAFAVRRDPSPNAPRVAQAAATPNDQSKVEGGKVVLDKFEVFGTKSVNLDLPRTRDDTQPYVVFDHEQLAKSQATNLSDFFRTRLTMASGLGLGIYGNGSPNTTIVNLRGLGTNQTLILLDGRRMPSGPVLAGSIGNPTQPVINGIPLAMIERIEVLSSTASGIYGGSATGGVINIITRKDFSGALLSLTYANTFDTDSARRRVDFNASTSLRGGATMLTLSASHESSNDILTQDRDFARRARLLLFANNPTAITGAAAPPRGYTTNIRAQGGVNLVLKPQYGGTALNSPITFVPVGYTGIASDNAAGLVANAGRYNLDLPDDLGGGRSWLTAFNSPASSLGLGLRQKISPWLEGYVDYQWTRQVSRIAFLSTSVGTGTTLPATAPNNPFTTAVVVTYPLPNARFNNYLINTTNRLTGGLVAKLPGEWQAGFDYTWGLSKNLQHTGDATVLGDPDGPTGPRISFNNSVSTGVNDVLRDLNRLPLDLATYQMPDAISDNVGKPVTQSATVRASGPAFRLSTGEVILSGSMEWQQDVYPEGVQRSVGATTPVPSYFWAPEISGSTRSAYLEARVPLLTSRAGGSRQARLELQLAGRYDASQVNTVEGYVNGTAVPSPNGPFPAVTRVTRDFADTSATAGLRYVPLPDVTLRASFGTGFLAPSVTALLPTQFSFANSGSGIVDPKRGGIPATVAYDQWGGGNPGLKPELSESISGGVILTPRFWPGFRLSLDYTKITKTDEITTLSLQQALSNEDALPGVIVRAPLTAADQAAGYTGGAVTRVYLNGINIARREVEAVDIQADYTRKTMLGEFRAYAAATFNLLFAGQVVPSAPLLDQVAYLGNPLKWRGNAGLDWSRGRWSAGWNVQYYDSQYLYAFGTASASIASTVLGQGTDRFPVQFYHEAQIGYDFAHEAAGWRRMFSDLQILVGIQNVFNTEPPLRAQNSDRVGIQMIEDPRLRRYTLSVKKRF